MSNSDAQELNDYDETCENLELNDEVVKGLELSDDEMINDLEIVDRKPESKISGPDDVDEPHFWDIIKHYVKDEGLLSHQIESFNDYIDFGIKKVIDEEAIISVIPKKGQKYEVHFGSIYVAPPSIIDGDRKLRKILPSEARDRDLTYDSAIQCDIKEVLYEDDHIIEETLHRRITIGRTPIMLRSNRCNLSRLSKDELISVAKECENDHGGYFIIKGNERVLIAQMRGIYNQVIVLKQKAGEKYSYVAEIRSMSEETGHSVLIKAMIGSNNRDICLSIPHIRDNIPAGIVLKALGITKEQDIVNIIGLDSKEAIKYVNLIIRDSYFIESQDDALTYIGQYAMHTITKDKRKTYAFQVVETELFPHLGISATIKEKTMFLGHILKKLISTYIGIRNPDDRDNLANKRIETAGTLCSDLFRTLFKRWVNTIKLQLEKKKTTSRADAMSVITKINSITTGLKHCFPAGTLVTMSNGLSIPIERLSETGGECVLGWNGSGFVSSRQTGLIKQGIKDVIRLTFEDGRTIRCTPDHKILTQYGWLEASKIPISTKIISGIEYPEDLYDNDWTANNRNDVLASVRMLGFMMPNRQSKQPEEIIYLDSINDVFSFTEDYKVLTGETLSYDFDEHKDVFSVKVKWDDDIKGGIPSFIMDADCPSFVIREFLGGLFGRYGSYPRLVVDQRTYIKKVELSMITDVEHKHETKHILKNILKLLEKIGVFGTCLCGPYKLLSDRNKLIYFLRLFPNTCFQSKIGFRYCVKKSFELTIISSYWRMIEETERQDDIIKKRANEIINNNPEVKIFDALKISRNELELKEHILSKSIHSDFIRRMEVSKFDKQLTNMPYYMSKLVDIRHDGKTEVYDIGVEVTHSFIANGLTVHNCFACGNWGVQRNAYIRTGVSQVVSRMTFGATLSHLRRIVIPIGKEGKNAKIRQIHTSQFGSICPSECFDPKTPILLWDGSTKLAQDIKVGDTLIDDTGNPTKVRTTCSGETLMFEVQQKNGINYTVTSNHILTLKIRLHGRILCIKKKYEVIMFDKEKFTYAKKYFNTIDEAKKYKLTIGDNILDIKIEDYLNLTNNIKNNLYGFKCKGVMWPKQEVELDPYTLGLWLGDEKGITLQHLKKSLENKHIPREYLINDRETRMKVLAGLIDSDNSVRAGGMFEIICQVSKHDRLVVDTIFLARSLGFYCRFNSRAELSISGIFLHDIFSTDYLKNKHQALYLQTPIKVIKKDIGPFVGWQLEGNGRFLLKDFTTVHNTPEGQSAGIVLNFSMLTKVTKRIPTTLVREVVEDSKYIRLLNDIDFTDFKNSTSVFINGILVGVTKNPDDLVDTLKIIRKSRRIDPSVSITYNIIDNEVKICCDAGRAFRPFFTIDADTDTINIRKADGMNWRQLVRSNKIIYLDVSEIENSVIAMNPKDIRGTWKSDYCEIHPAMLLGVMGSIIPFPDHNPSARNCFFCSQGKQAIGMFALSYRQRTDTIVHVLDYPQRPIVSTKLSDYMGFNNMPSGVNAVVAIISYTGLTSC